MFSRASYVFLKKKLLKLNNIEHLFTLFSPSRISNLFCDANLEIFASNFPIFVLLYNSKLDFLLIAISITDYKLTLLKLQAAE